MSGDNYGGVDDGDDDDDDNNGDDEDDGDDGDDDQDDVTGGVWSSSWFPGRLLLRCLVILLPHLPFLALHITRILTIATSAFI